MIYHRQLTAAVKHAEERGGEEGCVCVSDNAMGDTSLV
jgi:hypothetical protein